MKRITLVVGARPNFMKAAPIWKALEEAGSVALTLVHTGQHYDARMSGTFFEHLGLPAPHVDLGVGSGSHAVQTGQVMMRFETALAERPADLVIVVGDVNSTVACALTAVKQHVPVAHVESGLRSRDRTMPEEINRIVTDGISSLLFVTEPSGVANLRAEGIPGSRVHHVGNTMIDSLLRFRDQALAVPPPLPLPERFAVLTLHRPANVDVRAVLEGIVAALEVVSADLPLVWPLHPRTEKQLEAHGLLERVRRADAIHLLPPCSYLEFLGLMSRADLVLTDSGGIQEEALVLRVPVVTLRENTERPITIECGGNVLAGSHPARIAAAASEMLGRSREGFRVPELWDGRAGERIAAILGERLERGIEL